MWSCRLRPTPGRSCSTGTPCALQVSRGPDAREHQQLRRHQRAGAQQDFARGLDLFRFACLPVFDADGAAPFHQHARGARIGDHLQVGPAQRGREVRLGRAEALAVLVGDLVQAHALLVRAVEVVVARKARLDRGLHEHRPEAVGRAQVHHVQRAARAVELVGAALVVLGLAEVRQHVAPAPTRVAQRGPMVVVGAVAARVDHRVDGARAAQHLAARLVGAAAVESRLRHGVEFPVGLPGLGQQGEAGGAMDQHAAIRRPCFDQCDPHLRVFTEARRQYAPGRAATDDDVVEIHCHSANTFPMESTTLQRK